MTRTRYLALTCMKNEGPFILEWISYHLAIGFDHFLVYSNDCEDGTDGILNRLAEMGIVTHHDNPRRKGRASHQVRAYRRARKDPAYAAADWVAVIDADEFINVHVGDKSIQALTAAVPDAQAISLTWRLFGCSDRTSFHDSFLTASLRRAAPEFCPRPSQAWGMKTIHRTEAVDVIGCHRPRAVPDDDWKALNWVDGNGRPMPDNFFTGNWRMNRKTAGYELAQVNHYAVRTRETFLLKTLRGRAFGGQDIDAGYWDKMNQNTDSDASIQPVLPRAMEIFRDFMEDPTLSELHGKAVLWHRSSIDAILATDDGQQLLKRITPDMFGRVA